MKEKVVFLSADNKVLEKAMQRAKRAVRKEAGTAVSKICFCVNASENGSIHITGNSKLKADGRTPALNNDQAGAIVGAVLKAFRSEIESIYSIADVVPVCRNHRVDGVLFCDSLLYCYTQN